MTAYLDYLLFVVESGLQSFDVKFEKVEWCGARLSQHAREPDVAGSGWVQLDPQRHGS